MTVQEIIQKQLEVLDEIDFINKNEMHGFNQRVCKCKTCLKVRELGKEYERLGVLRRVARGGKHPDQRMNEIIGRKYTMTKLDLEYLFIEKKMTRKEATEVLSVSYSFLHNKCKQWGVSHDYVRSERLRRFG